MNKLRVVEHAGLSVRVFDLDVIGTSGRSLDIQHKVKLLGQDGVFEVVGRSDLFGKAFIEILDRRWRKGEFDGRRCTPGTSVMHVLDLFDGSLDESKAMLFGDIVPSLTNIVNEPSSHADPVQLEVEATDQLLSRILTS